MCPPASFTHHPPTSSAPASTAPTSLCQRRSTSGRRVYRCSKCGKVGHNVRSCPAPQASWYRQRCSICGRTGHNARNCSARSRCRVCNGSGKLTCSQCGGSGGGSTLQKRVTASKKKIARMSGGAVFFNVAEGADGVHVDKDGKIGGKSVIQVRMAKKEWGDEAPSELDDDGVCNRCLGTGYLSCMACTDDD